MRNVKLIPYVCGAGGQVPGAERAASELKKRGMTERLASSGLNIEWAADADALYDLPSGARAHEILPDAGTPARRDIVLEHCRFLQQHVMQAVKNGALPLTVGGDHAMALGSVSGLARAKNAAGTTGIVWIDAHADINTPDTSPSQALHGMPIAALLGMGDPQFVALAGDTPVLSPGHIVYIGLRDVDPGERDYIHEMNIAAFYMEDIREQGLQAVFDRALEIIATAKAKALSIDLDGFNPQDAPAVGTPVEDGLDAAQTIPFIEDLARRAQFDLIEIAEYNPTLPGSDKTAALIEKLIKTLAPV